jgi:hypothetical protein
MVEIRKDGVLRPAQLVTHEAAEWRQLHEIPRLSRTSQSPLGEGSVTFDQFSGDIAAKASEKLNAERACSCTRVEKRLLGGRNAE